MPHPAWSIARRPGPDARRGWAALLVLLFLATCLATPAGVGLSGFLFLGTALCWWRACRQALRRHWRQVRWVWLTFLLHALFALFQTLADGRGAANLDAPARMCMMLPAMLVVLAARPPLRVLWLGAAAGAVAALAFVAWQVFALGIARPGGWINPITFGDLALCLALLSFTGASLAARGGARRMLAWTLAGGLCGLAASLLTGSRGGWVVLPAAVALFASARSPLPRRARLALPLLAAALAALAWTLPHSGVRARVETGIADLRLYRAGDPAYTSLGVRLELWRAGLRLAGERPWMGQDMAAWKRRMHAWVEAGELRPLVFAPPEPPHLHNDALQVLVTGGWPGLLAWAATLAAPLCFFLRRLGAGVGGVCGRGVALAGVLFVLAYIGFGLSEVIFWSMKSCVFYALTLSLLMGWCLAEQEEGVPAGSAEGARVPRETDRDAHASHPRARAAGCAGRRGAGVRRWPATVPGRTAGPGRRAAAAGCRSGAPRRCGCGS